MEKNTAIKVNELMEIEGELFEEMQETYRKEIERRLQAKADTIPIIGSDGSPLKKNDASLLVL